LTDFEYEVVKMMKLGYSRANSEQMASNAPLTVGPMTFSPTNPFIDDI
jgi:hypothetical protein